MNHLLPHLIFLAGLGQMTILIASALVPFRLKWREELRGLPRLHRQMHWVYGGYVVLSIIAFAALSMLNAAELASGSSLARGFCAYVAVFWGIRLAPAGRLRYQTISAHLVDQGRILRFSADVCSTYDRLFLGRAARRHTLTARLIGRPGPQHGSCASACKSIFTTGCPCMQVQ